MSRGHRAPAAILAGLLLLALPASSSSGSLREIYDKAGEAFWNGDYQAAVEGYARLEELGVREPAVSFNLATAHARQGQLGRAVQHYERALRRDPGHADSLHNLQVTREFLARRASEAGRDADLAPAVGPWRAVLDRFSEDEAASVFLVLFVALFAALALRRFAARAEMARLTLGVLAGVLLLLAAAMGAVTVGKLRQSSDAAEAVVVAAELLEVVEGPESGVQRFRLEEGTRVRIVERREGWTRLRDDQGRDGWAPAAELGEI